MSQLVADCPRCGANKITFNLISVNYIRQQYGWQKWYEVFCVCRSCNRSTIFVVSENSHDSSNYLDAHSLNIIKESVNNYVNIESYISLKDCNQVTPPDHLPPELEKIFKEGASCLSINCHNASSTMFRLCLDIATKNMLPENDENGLNSRIRRSLGLRLQWLIDQNIIPESLKELSSCIKENGNDGAHEGSVTKEDAEDILDFTFIMLERVYTEPKRIELARERRSQRRVQA